MPNAQSPNPFLDEIEEEHHRHLLEAGNLGPKRKSSEWTGENSWTSQGYLAVVIRSSCACGAYADNLAGVFHIEQTPSGARRQQALDTTKRIQIPLDGSWKVSSVDRSVQICPACLSANGFSLPQES
jgi:hypothetical protein